MGGKPEASVPLVCALSLRVGPLDACEGLHSCALESTTLNSTMADQESERMGERRKRERERKRMNHTEKN